MIIYIGFILLSFLGIVYFVYNNKQHKIDNRKYDRKPFLYNKKWVILGFDLDDISHFELINFNDNQKWLAHLNNGKKKILDACSKNKYNVLEHIDIDSTTFVYVYLNDDLNHIPINISTNFITFITNMKQENYTVEQKIYVKK